jgi:hypothetical protein
MSYRSESLAFLLIGLYKTLDPFNSTGGGPSNGRVTTNRTCHSATVFSPKVVSVLVSTVIVRACDSKPDLSAVVFCRTVSWKN